MERVHRSARAQARVFRDQTEDAADARRQSRANSVHGRGRGSTTEPASKSHHRLAKESLERVTQLLKTNSPAWPDDSRHKLGDYFLQTLTGHRHGAHAALGDRTHLKHKKSSQLKKDHIHTAKMEEESFPHFLELLLGESAPFLASSMWPDATENDADGKLSFQETYRFFQVLNNQSEEVHAAFMFDVYDKDDSGFISLKEIAGMVNDAKPGGFIEQELLQLSMLTNESPGKKAFYFDEYWRMKQEACAKGAKTLIETARQTLGLASNVASVLSAQALAA
eukprot:127091-Prymnesium_polylepis.2